VKEKEDGENCINCSLITAPNAITVIKSVPCHTKSGRTKIGRKSLKHMGRQYLEDVGMGCIPFNIQAHGPFSFQVV
jgi:hypothetical protein